MKRPCSQFWRPHGFEPYDEPIDWNQGGGLTLRCGGECDEDIGMCFCPSNTAFGRIPRDPSLPPSLYPERVGRQMGHHCQPNAHPETKEKTPLFGDVDWELLFGSDGWCTNPEPQHHCPCYLDGSIGRFCETPVEHYCANQCSGHGECYLGWCDCHEGYFGHDCAYRLPGVEWTDGLSAPDERPWIKDVARTPAAQDPSPGKLRKRPLIYVYELPPMYNQLMLQYRFNREACTHRLFGLNNDTEFRDQWGYNSEPGLHEMILQSEHRTLDPDEADFFYLPVYSSCAVWPVIGAADFPWFHGGNAGTMRPTQILNMHVEILAWIRSHYPYWDRNNGRDHLLLVTHDEGSCHVPGDMRNATILSHWGRKDEEHQAMTAYNADNYTNEIFHRQWQPEGHFEKMGKFPCYDPKKDLVIPAMYSPFKYIESPLFGAEKRKRDILGFFKGEMRRFDDRNVYSRGIRQNLSHLCTTQNWWENHKIWVNDTFPRDQPGESYSKLYSRSKFCFVLPGDGWSARFEDAILHGCIPVIIQDNIDLPFENIFDFPKFTVRIAQKDIANVPEILKAFSKEKVASLQKALQDVWSRWHYTSYRPYARSARDLRKRAEDKVEDDFDEDVGEFEFTKGGEGGQSPGRKKLPWDEKLPDAFETMLAWLYWKKTLNEK